MAFQPYVSGVIPAGNGVFFSPIPGSETAYDSAKTSKSITLAVGHMLQTFPLHQEIDLSIRYTALCDIHSIILV